MYNNYEEYMQNVLGYNVPNTYRENENYYYESVRNTQNLQEVNKLYPEIYAIIYPMVQKVCSRMNISNVTEEQITQMVNEIYNVIEPEDDIIEARNVKNGDVRNPRQKETRRPKNNFLLRDLIRILIIRELLSGRPTFGPGMPRPPLGNNGMGPRPQILGSRLSK